MDGMHKWSRLALWIHTRAGMLDNIGRGTQAAICVDGKHRSISARVVGDQDKLARLLDADITRILAAPGIGIQ